MDFKKSDIGAQAAWKGFSSQTLYIATRIIQDIGNYEFFPEDIEDLIIKNKGNVVEAVQVKNLSGDLTLSSLASANTSKSGEGFFRRMCSLHKDFPKFDCIKVVYFNTLGSELKQLDNGDEAIKKTLTERLVDKHTLTTEEAKWIIDSLCFEKVDVKQLDESLLEQMKGFVPVMAAPTLAKELLIQHVSELSCKKGYTTLAMWEEQIHKIGASIAALDGFYKEYNKSLIRLSEFNLPFDYEALKHEYSQGVNAHPAHIRHNLDFRRSYWIDKIQEEMGDSGAVVVKGVSGQGKSTLCYRYLIDFYPEGCVFSVNMISTEEQAQNLVSAIDALGKHNENLVIYIDVKPGETLWAFLLQELQLRGISIPVLISIRDEDYNATPINGKSINYSIIELSLSKLEAEQIYNAFIAEKPSGVHRTFEEAWNVFGGEGPLIEFAYLLTNNQSLTQRLQEQVDAFIRDGISDEWLSVLDLVCYAGKMGCSVDFNCIKSVLGCSNLNSAIRRFKDEYLIRLTPENKVEALHPVRARIVFELLKEQIGANERDIVFNTLACVSSYDVRIILLDYFSNHNYESDDIIKLSQVSCKDWQAYGNALRVMLWLDVKRYVESNRVYFDKLLKERGKGWMCFLPLDPTNVSGRDDLIADMMKSMPLFKQNNLQEAIDEVKTSLTSLHIDYQATDYFIKNSKYPNLLPSDDQNRSEFGYSLFWMKKRGAVVDLSFNPDEIAFAVCDGELQSAADAIRGLFEQESLNDSYQKAIKRIEGMIISELDVLEYSVNEDEVICKFIPPLNTNDIAKRDVKNANQYWRIKMLDILKQLYPDKEYIDIELIGVDLFRDLGIQALDHKLRIEKKNRHDSWVTEVNGWVKTRIEFSLRPTSWDDYIYEIDELRKEVHELIKETLKLIDDLYKKGRFTQARGNQIDKRVNAFRRYTFAENRLPCNAVDSYCLYSEGNARNLETEYFPMRQLLAVEKYKMFRSTLNDVFFSLDNFYTQMIEVIRARVNNQGLDNLGNPNLSMFNLYAAAKALLGFHQEYKCLFERHGSLDDDFAKEELESLLTLVNVWRHVLDKPPKGATLSYDAKQQYKKGSNYFTGIVESITDNGKYELIKGERYIYISANLDLQGEDSLEVLYREVVLMLREAFSEAILPSSIRWHAETQPLQFALLPCFDGSYSSVAFSIPFYRILDTKIDEVANPMFPCEIEHALTDYIFPGKKKKTWIQSIAALGGIKTHLERYKQVLMVQKSEECENNYEEFKTETIESAKELWNEFSLSEEIITKLMKVPTENYNEFVQALNSIYDCFDEIESCIMGNQSPEELINYINLMVTGMILLSSNVEKLDVAEELASRV